MPRSFAPTSADVAAQVAASAARWAALPRDTELPFDTLLAAYGTIHATAEQLSGGTEDAQQRALVYYSLYEDSGGNLMFPLIASHGSMWGVTHTQRIDKMLRALRPLSRRGTVQTWMDALDAIRDINRRVFVEIYTTFYFTRFYGRHPRASELVKPEVLALYNRVHAAVEDRQTLTLEERRAIYFEVFVHEQHDIVDPGIHQAVASCPRWVVALFQRVRPRFKYFPPGESLAFTDFTAVEQRNREGLRAMDFAEMVGPQRVLDALAEY